MRMRTKRAAIAIAIAAMGTGLSACSSGGGDGGGVSAQPDTDLGSLNLFFEHGDYTSAQDCVEPGVCLTRDVNRPVYARGADGLRVAVQWACGPCGAETSAWYPDVSSLYQEADCFDGMDEIVGNRTCFLAPSGTKYDISWTQWPSDSRGGGFAYWRDALAPDGRPDASDNCKLIPNADQADADSDGVGDACDNCVDVANPGQEDVNHDGFGDACEDSDRDGLLDAADNCPLVANADQADADSDGVGDVCDNCVDVANPGQEDSERSTPGTTFVHPSNVGSAVRDPVELGATTRAGSRPRQLRFQNTCWLQKVQP